MYGQVDTEIAIYGTVVDQDSLYYLPNTHVINKRTASGTITNGLGEFVVKGRIDDTLVFSNVSFQFYYHRITGTEADNLIIRLKTRNYLLNEVSVAAYRLTSNDPKPMAFGEPMVPRNEDIYTPHQVPATLGNPVDLLYQMFSRRAKELEKLQQLYVEDYYRQKLKQGNNRTILTNMTGLNRQELEQFMFYCKYSDTYINTLNDYDFLMSLMSCYQQYIRERELNQLLDEQSGEQQSKESSERFKD